MWPLPITMLVHGPVECPTAWTLATIWDSRAKVVEDLQIWSLPQSGTVELVVRQGRFVEWESRLLVREMRHAI